MKIFRLKTISYKSSVATGAGTERSCLAYACFSLLLGLHTGNVIAGPEGGQVTAGQATISTPTATSTVINQSSQNVAIDWQSYNVKQNELVQYLQPNAAASALNKIFDQNPSQIFGTIKANGQVILVNPNGVFFSPTARVSVGSLIASGIDIKTDDFMQGKLNFDAAGAGGDGVVVNQGLIEAATGGSVNLIGKAVSNEGLILAHAGQVNLVAGEKMTMDFDGDGLIQFVVDREVLENAHGLDSQVNNSGTIEANGGSVLLSGNASKEVFSKVVNNSGVIKAGRIDKSGGKIRLVGSGAGNSLVNTGTISASSTTAGEDGGSVEITAENITSSGTIEANAVDGNGGQINIESEDTTLLTGESVVSVASEMQQGGVAKILGDKVGLLDESEVVASGATGGGEVLVGGDFQGKNPDVKNASKTYVATNTTINADATASGDGGKVILWADEWTKFYGSISAQGGVLSGDGGFVEVSGKQSLTFLGTVVANALNGNNGTLLLDPNEINIVDGAAGSGDHDQAGGDLSADGTINFTDADAGSNNLSVGQIETTSGTGTDININAGQINFQNTVNIDLSTDATSISFHADSTQDANSALGNDTITNAGSNPFSIIVDAGETINFTALGAIDLSEITLDAGAGGAINITGSSLTYNTAGTLNVNNVGGTWDIGTGGVTIGAGATVNATSGTINVAGDWTNGGTFNNNTGTVVFDGTGAQSITAGGDAFNILNISGTGNTVSVTTNLTVDSQLGLLTDGTLDASSIPTLDVNNVVINGASSVLTAPGAANSFLVSGNFNFTSGTFNNNSGEVTFDGTGQQNITGTPTFNNINFNGVGPFVIFNDLDVDGNLTLSSGDLDESGNDITIGGNWDDSGGGTFTAAGNTVTFDGGGAQSIDAANSIFNNLTIDLASTAVTLINNPLDVDGNLTISNTASLDEGTQDITVAGAWNSSGGSFAADSNTVTFDGNGAQTVTTAADTDFFNFTVDGGSTAVSLAGATLDVNGALTISGTASLDEGAQDITVAGNWDSSTGTFAPDSNTVFFDGGVTQTLDSGGDNFQGLTISNNSTVELLNSAIGNINSLTINSGSVFDIDGQNVGTVTTFSNDGTFALQGNETITSITNDTDSGTIEFNGANVGGQTFTITDFFTSYFDLDIDSDNATDTYQLGAAIDVDGDLTVSSGILSVGAGNQSINVAGDVNFTGGDFTEGTGTVVFDGLGTQLLTSAGETFGNVTITGLGTVVELQDNLDVNGTLLVQTSGVLDVTASNRQINAGGDVNFTGGDFTERSGTVVFDGSGAQSLTSDGEAFNNITITGAGTEVDLQDALDVNGTLLVQLSGVLDVNTSNQVNAAGDVNFTGGDLTEGTGTFVFDGGGAQSLTSAAETFNNLTVSGGGTLNLADTLDVGNDLTVSSGTLDVSGNNAVSVGGNVDFTGGTFDDEAGTFTLDGAGAQQITSAGQSFFDLDINKASGSATFLDDLSVADNLITANNAYDIAFDENVTVSSTATLDIMNTGTLTIGDASDDAANFAGALVAQDSSTVTLAGTITTTNNDDITLGDDIDIAATTTISTGNGAGGNICIGGGGTCTTNGTGNIDATTTTGTINLTLEAGTGTVDVNSSVGGTTNLDDFNINIAASIEVDDIDVDNDIFFKSNNYTFTGGQNALSGPGTLTFHTLLITDQISLGTSSDNRDLDLNVLTDFEAIADGWSEIVFGIPGNTANHLIDYSTGTALDDCFSGAGCIRDPWTLNGVWATAGNEGQATTGDGSVTIVGTTLVSLTSDIDVLNDLLSGTPGSFDYTDAVIVDDDSTDGPNEIVIDLNGQSLTFSGGIDSVAGEFNPIIFIDSAGTGSLTINSDVGVTDSLGDVIINADQGAGAITFKAVTATPAGFALVDIDSTTFNVGGLQIKEGGTGTITNLDIGAGGGTTTITLSDMTDTNADGTPDASTLGIDTSSVTSTSLNLTGDVIINPEATSTSPINLGQVQSTVNANLTINAPGGAGNNNVTLAGIGGGVLGTTTNDVGVLTVDADGAINIGGNIETTGNQTFSNTVTLIESAEFNTAGGGTGAGTTISFGTVVAENDAADEDFTVNAGSAGSTTVGIIGVSDDTFDDNDVNILDITAGGGITLNGDIESQNSQTYNSAVDVNADIDIDNGAGNITFNDVVDSQTGNSNLDVDATNILSFTSRIGGTNTGDGSGDIGILNLGAVRIDLGGDVQTTGTQTYADPVRLTTAGTTTFTSTNGGAGAAIDFQGRVDGAGNGTENLVVDAGTSTAGFTAIGGGNTAANTNDLGTIDISGSGGINIGGNVETTGTQTFNDDVTLTATAQFNSDNTGVGGAAIQFAGVQGTNTGTEDLTIEAGTSTVTFTSIGNISGAADAGDVGILAINGGGGINVGGSVETAGVTATQDYNDAVDITGNATLRSDNGTITFADAVTSTANNNLTVNAGTAFVLFNNVIGGNNTGVTTNDIGILDITGGAGIQIGGGTVETTGTQDFNSDVTITADTTFESNDANITFDNNINSDAGQMRNLTFDTQTTGASTAATVTVTGATGNDDVINNLTVDTAGSASFGAIDVDQDITIIANEISFTGGSNTVAGSGPGPANSAGDGAGQNGTVTLKPIDVGTVIDIGASAVAADGELDLTFDTMNAIADLWTSIDIGDALSSATHSIAYNILDGGGPPGDETIKDIWNISGAALSKSGNENNAILAGTDGAVNFVGIEIFSADFGLTADTVFTNDVLIDAGTLGTGITIDLAGFSLTFDGRVSSTAPDGTDSDAHRLSIIDSANGAGNILTFNDDVGTQFNNVSATIFGDVLGVVDIDGMTFTIDTLNFDMAENGTGVFDAGALTVTDVTDIHIGENGASTFTITNLSDVGNGSSVNNGVAVADGFNFVNTANVILRNNTIIDTTANADTNVVLGPVSSFGTTNTHDLTINAGTAMATIVSIGGADDDNDDNDIGVLNLTATGGISLGGDIQTVGNQTITGDITLTADSVITSDNTAGGTGTSSIQITGNIAGTGTGTELLELDAATSTVTITGFIGSAGGTADAGDLKSLDISGQGGISLGGGAETAAANPNGSQFYDGNVTLTADSTFFSNNNAITFANGSTISGSGAVRSLTLNSGTADVSLTGAVGAGNLIGPIDIDGGSLTIANNVTSQGAIDIDLVDDDPGGAGAETFKHTGGTISASGADITITADDMQLAGTSITVDDGQAIILKSTTAADGWDLGTNANVANRLEIDSTELSTLNTTGTTGVVRIGTTTAATGTVSAAIADPVNVEQLHLQAAAVDDNTAAGSIAITGGLKVTAAGAVTLEGANDVDTLATGAGITTFSFRDTDGYEIGTVDGMTGIAATTITLDLDGGTVTQDTAPAAAVTATDLELIGDGIYTLTEATNDVDNLEGNTTANISYRDADGFNIGSATTASTGITTTADLTLQTGGAVTQTAGDIITADGLELLGDAAGDTYTLTENNNDVNIIAGLVRDAVTYTDIDDLDIGTVNSVGLLIAAGSPGNIFLTATDIDVDQDVRSNAHVRLTATTGSIESGGGTIIAGASASLDAATTVGTSAATLLSIDANGLEATGTGVFVQDLDTLPGAAGLDITGVFIAGVTTSGGSNGDIHIETTDGGINTQANVTADGSGDVFLDANGVGALLQTAVGTIDSTTGNITLQSDDDITLSTDVGAATTGTITIVANEDGTLNAGETGLYTSTAINTLGNAAAGAVDISAETITIAGDVFSGTSIDTTSAAGTTLNNVTNFDAAGGTISMRVDSDDAGADTLDLGSTSMLTAGTIILTGGAGDDDILQAQDVTNTWGNTGSGTLDNANLSSTAAWSSFGTISGGLGVDTINQDVAGTVAGTITVDISGTGTVDGMAGTITSDGGDFETTDFDNIDEVLNTDIGNTITGAAAAAIANATWTIDGGGTEKYSDDLTGQDIDFSNTFRTLNGGSGNDTFNISSSYTGNLSGFAGNDQFNLVNLATVLTGNLDGGANDDLFDFNDTASVTGGIKGDTGTDTLDFAGSTLVVNITLTDNPGNPDGIDGEAPNIITNAGLDDFEGINVLTSPGGAILFGPNDETFWNITGVNTGTFGDTQNNITANAFNGFTINGGTANDTFQFAAAGQLTGVADGGGGAGVDTLTGSTGADTFTITGNKAVTALIDVGGNNLTTLLTDIENIDGSVDDGSGSPFADTGVDIFAINAGWGGNLDGAGGNDQFNFGNTFTVGGSIDGGAGASDILDWSLYNTSRAVTLTSVGTNDGFAGTAASITGGFDNINEVVGSTTTDDSLNGLDATSDWNFGGVTETYVSTNTLTFSSFHNLNGGDGFVNTFNAQDDHIGSINGGDQGDIFNFNNGNFSITGSVFGRDGNDIFNIDGTTTSGTMFAQGGDDTFNVTSINAPVSLDGGTGDDIFNVGNDIGDLNTNTLTLVGGTHTAGIGDTLNYDDSAEAAQINYTFGHTFISRTDGVAVTTDNINMTSGQIENVNFTGSGNAGDILTLGNFVATFGGDVSITDVESILDLASSRLVANDLTITNASTTIGTAVDLLAIDVDTLTITGGGLTNVANIFKNLDLLTIETGANDVRIGALNGGSITNNTGATITTTGNVDLRTQFGTNESIGTSANKINIANAATVTANTDAGSGGIFLNQSAGTMTVAGINAGTGNIDLMAVADIQDTGTISGNKLITMSGTTTILDFGHSVSAFEADATGNVRLDNTGFLALDNITTNSGSLTINNTSGNISINGAVNSGAGDTAVTNITNGSITSGGGTITSNNLALITAGIAGGIGVGGAINTTTTGTISLTTSGAGTAGNASISEANAINTSDLTLDSADASGQTFRITSAGAITVDDADVGISNLDGNDTLILTGSGGTFDLGSDLNTGGTGLTLNGQDTSVTANRVINTGTGSFNVGGDFNGGGNTVSITANSSTISGDTTAGSVTTNVTNAMNFGGDLNSGGTVSITANSSTISGDTTADSLTANVANTMNFGGTITVANNLSASANTTNLNGDVVADDITFAGGTLNVNAGTIMQSRTNIINLNSNVSGGSSLQILPANGGDDVNISNSTTSLANTLDIRAGAFTGFTGDLVIGGEINPITDPIDITNTTRILANDILVGDDLVTNARSVTFLSGTITLDAGLISVGGPGGGQINMVAIGPGATTCTIDCSGVTNDPGNLTANSPIIIEAGSGLIVTEGTIDGASNIDLTFDGGDVQIALGENPDNAQNMTGNANGTELDSAIDAFISNVLGLSVNAVIVTFFNPASALIGLQEVAFIDVGLFEEELTLFGTIGRGIALSLAQCEEIEGCAPNVTEEELVELIEGLEGRIAELERRLAEESDPVERTRLEELIAGFTQELENFRDYQQQLAEFFEPADEEFEDEFADEFTDEFVEEAPAGPPDVDTVEKLAGMLKVVNARIQWLESLKDDPEERARLSEITGMELTKEDLDAIIEATRAEAGFIENQLKLLLEGKEARNDDVQPLFTADAGDDANIMKVAYGPSLLDLDTQGTTLYYR